MKKSVKKIVKLCLALTLSASVLFGGNVMAQKVQYGCVGDSCEISFDFFDYGRTPFN